VKQPDYSSAISAGIGASVGGPVIPQGISSPPGSDEDFQQLLLGIAAKAGERCNGSELIDFFCRVTRDFFQVAGVYFWRCSSADELVAERANGKMAESFVGRRLRSHQSTVTAEAVRQRRTIFANHINPSLFPLAKEFEARSLMSAPLVVSNEVIGAVTFLHDSKDDFFNQTWQLKRRSWRASLEPS
jgi:GAF domain-containing protein